MQLEKAKAIAERVLAILEPFCERIVIAGSIRRQKPEVRDIELLAIPKYVEGADMLDARIRSMVYYEMLGYRLNKLGRKTYGAKNKLLVHVPSGIGIDLFSTTAECWPVALFVRTGGKVTNQQVSMAALRKGWQFHAYGRGFTTPDGEIVCHSEHDIFKAVGWPYKEPWERQ